MYVLYYVSMLRCWQLEWIVVWTNHPCLGVGCHSWYQTRVSIIRHWRPYFWKSMVRIRFNVCIRTIIVLTGGKLTGIYFLQFTFCNDGPMPTYEGKYPRAGWYEFRTHCLKVRFAWGSPYRAVGVDVRRATSHDRVSRASRDLRMSCGHFHKTWICSCDICSAVHVALNAWAPLQDKWWCMSYVYIVLFCRYANHNCVN
jgi:hypothetical protein